MSFFNELRLNSTGCLVTSLAVWRTVLVASNKNLVTWLKFEVETSLTMYQNSSNFEEFTE